MRIVNFEPMRSLEVTVVHQEGQVVCEIPVREVKIVHMDKGSLDRLIVTCGDHDATK